jgi:regulatory protein
MKFKQPNYKPPSEQNLYEAAIRYLERYASSAENLARVLERRIRRWEMRGQEKAPEDVTQWIDKAVQKCIALGYVNDDRYTEQKIVSLRRQGRSKMYILRSLQLKGVAVQTIARFLNGSEEDELQAAQRYVERRRLGKKRDDESRQKDLAKLVRAGFPLNVARRALNK